MRHALTMLVMAIAMAAAPGLAFSQAASQPATGPSSQPAKELLLDLGKKITMKLTLVPSGTFLMGCAQGEKDAKEAETPQREVAITKPFYVGIYEVTQEQWAVVMGTTPWKGMVCGDEGATHAANFISWVDATAFCKKLSVKTGKTVCLPTEAQWEYACRAGSKTRVGYGDDADYSKLEDYAWFVKNAVRANENYPHAVGQKKPNDFGLYDMHGNVWEWVADWWADSYKDAEAKDPTGPAKGTQRILRGGSFRTGGKECRSAVRANIVPTNGWSSYGFRVVVVVPQ